MKCIEWEKSQMGQRFVMLSILYASISGAQSDENPMGKRHPNCSFVLLIKLAERNVNYSDGVHEMSNTFYLA